MKRKIRQLVLDPVFFNSKTHLMKYLELKFETPIEELIMEGGLTAVAGKLGVDPSTVWLWRQRFGLPNIGRKQIDECPTNQEKHSYTKPDNY